MARYLNLKPPARRRIFAVMMQAGIVHGEIREVAKDERGAAEFIKVKKRSLESEKYSASTIGRGLAGGDPEYIAQERKDAAESIRDSEYQIEEAEHRLATLQARQNELQATARNLNGFIERILEAAGPADARTLRDEYEAMRSDEPDYFTAR